MMTLKLMLREFRRIFVDKDLRSSVLIAPIIMGLGFASIYAHRRVDGVSIGIVDQDHSKASRALVRMVEAQQGVHIVADYEDRHTAHAALLDGAVSGFVLIPTDFSESLKRGKQAQVFVAADTSNFMVASPIMQAGAGAASRLSAGQLVRMLRKREVPQIRAQTLADPIGLDVRPIFNPFLDYSVFFLPGLLFVLIQQFIHSGIGFSIAAERQSLDEAERSAAARIPAWSVVIARIVPYAVVNFVFSLAYLYLLMPQFGIVPQSAPYVLLPLVAAFTLAAGSSAVLIAAFFATPAIALIALMFYSTPAFLISGFSWPDFGLPVALQALSRLVPFSYFGSPFRRALLGDLSFAYVARPMAELLAFAVVCFALACIVYARKLRAWHSGD